MADVSGVVQNVYQDGTIATRFGEKPLFKVVVDGQEYKHAFKKPAFGSGDYVSFDVKSGYPRDIDDKTVKVGAGADHSSSSPTTGDAPTSATGTPSGRKMYPKSQGVFPVPVDHPDRSVIRQNSLTQAREVVLNNRHFCELGVDEHVDEIVRIAHKFERYSAGDEIAEAMEEMGGSDE